MIVFSRLKAGRATPGSASRPRSSSVITAGAVALVTVASLAACSSSKSSDKAAGSTGSSSAAADPHTVAIAITADGCKSNLTSYASGPLTFNVSNKDATAVNEIELLNGERILGEKENMPPGFSGSFSLSLGPGDYTLYCPGATTERSTLKVTGAALSTGATDTSALLKQGTVDYGTYINLQIGLLVDAVTPLATALHGTDLAAAQTAYMKARPYYERIEPVAESFTTGSDDLDGDIDARADDVPADQLTGFHRIEYGLFDQKSLTGLGEFGDGLVANVKKLQALTAGLTYQPAELANGAVELLDEVSKSKITGEEERYSHIDMLDFQSNVEGSEQAFASLQPGLVKIDSTLSDQVSAGFKSLDTLLDKYRTTSNASGFVYFAALTDADKTALSQALQAVSEPLSKVASKVVGS